MAEEGQKYPVRLYDAAGQYQGEVEHDEDMSAATTRGGHMTYKGKTYLWDQRSSTWRESAGAYEVKGKMETPEPEQGTSVEAPPASGSTTRRA